MNSRDKGNVAEREVAALIQTWWRQLEPACTYVRTPLSGGWSTPELRTAYSAAGDLMTDATRFPFAVEVKRRESWSMANFVAGKASPVWGWWVQCQAAAAEMNAQPMLWVRRSREPWIIVIGEYWGKPMPEPDIRWDPKPKGAGAIHPVGYLATRLLATDRRFLRWFVRASRP